MSGFSIPAPASSSHQQHGIHLTIYRDVVSFVSMSSSPAPLIVKIAKKLSQVVITMKSISCAIVLLSTLIASPCCQAGVFDFLFKESKQVSNDAAPDNATLVNGLKEALSIGTKNAVNSVGSVDGFFKNQMIKILVPEKIRNVADLLGKVGFQKQVDDFVLSMNRAAEKAAPQAAGYFSDALKEMTFDDAVGIWKGGDTSATEYFKKKTHDRIFAAFKPVISSSMNEVGVTRSYKEMIQKYESLPFMKSSSLDLDNYVTNKALDGLFYTIGEEEKKIRTNPAARVTDLLKKVFGQ